MATRTHRPDPRAPGPPRPHPDDRDEAARPGPGPASVRHRVGPRPRPWPAASPRWARSPPSTPRPSSGPRRPRPRSPRPRATGCGRWPTCTSATSASGRARKLSDLCKKKEWKQVQRHPSGFRFPSGESFGEMQVRITDALATLRAAPPGRAGRGRVPRRPHQGRRRPRHGHPPRPVPAGRGVAVLGDAPSPSPTTGPSSSPSTPSTTSSGWCRRERLRPPAARPLHRRGRRRARRPGLLPAGRRGLRRGHACGCEKQQVAALAQYLAGILTDLPAVPDDELPDRPRPGRARSGRVGHRHPVGRLRRRRGPHRAPGRRAGRRGAPARRAATPASTSPGPRSSPTAGTPRSWWRPAGRPARSAAAHGPRGARVPPQQRPSLSGGADRRPWRGTRGRTAMSRQAKSQQQ